MTNAFSRSWEITKLTMEVIKKDKELLLFPLLAGIFSIIFVLAMVFPTAVSDLIEGNGVDNMAVLYAILFAIYFGLSFIATFFNVCVVYTTKKRFEGGNATFGESIKFAFSRIHIIAGWSIISATVGLVLRLIDNLAEKLGEVGEIVVKVITGILGAMWSLITVFVIPSMVYDNVGPITAFKKSVSTIKKTWGENLIRYYGLGIIEFVLIVVGAILTWVMLMISAALGTYAVISVIAVAAIYFIAVIVLFSLMNSIYNTALYVFAETGKVPSGFNENVVANAFVKNQ